MICTIYKITNLISNEVYIGQTWKAIEYRLYQHGKRKKRKLYDSIKEYGFNNFIIEPVALCYNQRIADYLENLYIQEYDSIKNGFNVRFGGVNGKFSEECKEKMSESHLGLPSSRKGKTHSLEAKIIGLAGKGRSPPNKGQKMSDEQKKKLSDARRGRRWTLIDGKRVWSLPEKKLEV